MFKDGGHGVRRSCSSEIGDHRSFADVVKNGENTKLRREDPKVEEKISTISWCGSKEEEEWMSRCAMGTLKSFMNLENINQRLESRGFSFSSSFLGDNRVLWSFENEWDRDGFLRNRFFWRIASILCQG